MDMDKGKPKPLGFKWFFPFLFLAVAFVLSSHIDAEAGGILSPGDISSLHDSVVGLDNCVKCHPKVGISNKVCEKCHKEITAVVASRKGYHHKVSSQRCVTCHTDHKGRDFTMVEWDKKKFDHSNIGYNLVGAHAKVECEKCHKTRTKAGFQSYLGAVGEKCAGCHEDKHKGEFKEPCEKCHNVESWTGKNVTFNHNKSSYRLVGKHQPVACEKCHVDSKKTGSLKVAKYTSCDTASCHDKGKFGNVHGTQFIGQRCDKCHGLAGFKPSFFKHEDAKYSGYKLVGKHEKTACAKCHRADNPAKIALYKPIKSGSCDALGCHDVKARGNIHGDQFKGQKCEKCHNEQGWKPARFDHNAKKYVGYKLTGKHEKVACVKCHAANPVTKVALYKPINVSSCDTKGCHDVKERGNIHRDQFKGQRCDKCHTTKDWKYDKKLHDYTKFKLVRWHLKIKCEDCHKTKGVWNDAIRTCSPCHYDPHKSQFAGGDNGCEPCHSFFRLAKERHKGGKSLNDVKQKK
jgi:hypothetical protein